MAGSQRLGKVKSGFLQRTVYNQLGRARREILVGPRFGVDNSVVRVGNGRVLVGTTDPLSFIPRLGARRSAWLSIHLIASDIATSGFSPQYGVFDFNLPPQMTDSQFSKYWRAFHTECLRLGISIVGGHTGRFEGCDYTIIGGGMLWSIVPEDRYLVSSMAMDGDELILTKSAAFGATAVLATAFPRHVKRALGTRRFEKVQGYLSRMTAVEDALTAAAAGVHGRGVTAMHDVTEGGVLAATYELSQASGLGAELELDNIPVSDETRAVSDLFRIDPLMSLGEGSLVIASRPQTTSKVLNLLSSNGIPATVVGWLSSKLRGCYGTSKGKRWKIPYPERDPYWKAYWTAVRRGWS